MGGSFIACTVGSWGAPKGKSLSAMSLLFEVFVVFVSPVVDSLSESGNVKLKMGGLPLIFAVEALGKVVSISSRGSASILTSTPTSIVGTTSSSSSSPGNLKDTFRPEGRSMEWVRDRAGVSGCVRLLIPSLHDLRRLWCLCCTRLGIANIALGWSTYLQDQIISRSLTIQDHVAFYLEMHVLISTIGLCPKDISKHNRTYQFYITQNILKLQFNIDTYIFHFTFFHFKHVDSNNFWSQFKNAIMLIVQKMLTQYRLSWVDTADGDWWW